MFIILYALRMPSAEESNGARKDTPSIQLRSPSTVSFQFNSTCTHSHTITQRAGRERACARHVAKVFNWTLVRAYTECAGCAAFRGGERTTGCTAQRCHSHTHSHNDACGNVHEARVHTHTHTHAHSVANKQLNGVRRAQVTNKPRGRGEMCATATGVDFLFECNPTGGAEIRLVCAPRHGLDNYSELHY